MRDDCRRWLGTQASQLWLLGLTCWGSVEGVGHHVAHTRDIQDVIGLLSNIADLPLLVRRPGQNCPSTTPSQAAGLAVQKSGSLKRQGGCPACAAAAISGAASSSWILMFTVLRFGFSGVTRCLSHKMFDLHFLLDSNPSGPLINRLKYFLIHF